MNSHPPVQPAQKPGPTAVKSGYGLPLLLALVTFLVYVPSLRSDFVYDARTEIFQEGFITSLAHLPDVLTLKVLGLPLMLGPRPGQLLFLMLNAALWGAHPGGFHLTCNLLHAANVALLFVLLRHLVQRDAAESSEPGKPKSILPLVTATLFFALHPLCTEAISIVNYSSDLLVTFFTLVAFLLAASFPYEKARLSFLWCALGALSCFAGATCKESGIATPLLLIVYGFLFRRTEPIRPWLIFITLATVATALFFIARFALAPPNQFHLGYLGGSLGQVFLIQPRLWVFMLGKVIWPVNLSADYTIENVDGLSTPIAFLFLAAVLLIQGGLAAKSRLGALGVAIFWLGLATVSNFIPLNRIMADRFYYLPMTGLALQMLAVMQLAQGFRAGLWSTTAPLLAALVPLTFSTLARERDLSNEASLWTSTLRVSPRSATAHNGLGVVLFQTGHPAEAMAQYELALQIQPRDFSAHNNLAYALLKSGRLDDAIAEYRAALKIDPLVANIHLNLGHALAQQGRPDEALAEYRQAIAVNPRFAPAYVSLGTALAQRRETGPAIEAYKKAAAMVPENAETEVLLGNLLLQSNRIDDAVFCYRAALQIDANAPETHNNLGIALVQQGRKGDAEAEFQEALRLQPHYPAAQRNLAMARSLPEPNAAPK